MFDQIFLNDERNREIRNYVLSQNLTSVMTDEERAKFWGLPEGCRMREGAKILSPEKLVCGKNVWIGEGAVLDASGGLEIGDNTSIGLNVMIWSHTSFLANLTFDNKINSELIARAKTTIGSGCFIAGPSVIYHGVELGDRSLVMPMSVITSSFKGSEVIGGSPAKHIKEIDEEFIESQLQKFKELGQIK